MTNERNVTKNNFSFSPDTLNLHPSMIKPEPGLEYGMRVCKSYSDAVCKENDFSTAEISSVPTGDLLTFRDCAEVLQSGATDDGVYTIRLPNSTQTVKVGATLERLLTFSRKDHLTDCDTKYIHHWNHSTLPGTHKRLTVTFIIIWGGGGAR